MGNSKRPRSKRTRTIVVSALVIVVAVAAVIAYLGLRGGDNSKVTYSTGTVQKMTLTSSVSGVGNVELTSSVTVDPGISGEVAELSVAVGDKVEQGQHLFTIINPQLDLEVANAQNNYNQAVLALEKAKLSVLQAQQNLADLYDQYEAQSTSTTQSTTPTTTTATSPTTSTTHSTTTTSSSTTSTTVGTTSSIDSSADAVLIPLATTQVAPGLGEAGVVLAAYAVAQTSGQTVQTSAQTGGKVTWLDIEAAQQEVASAKQQVAAAETQVESAKLALEQAKENAAKREVTAPISGVITALNIENGDTIGGSTGSAAGASSAAASTSTNSGTSSGSTGVMVITNLESFQVSVSLSETDISAVEVGQKATISFDALPDLTLTGKVTRVDTIGTNNQGVVSYTVIVTPDSTNPQVKGGMTASVNIITAVASDVLAVPNSAVKSLPDGTKYVQVLQNGQPSNVTVETGLSNDSYTEIKNGLEEGREIIIQTISGSSGTTSATTRSQGGLLNQGGQPGGVPFSLPGGLTRPGM